MNNKSIKKHFVIIIPGLGDNVRAMKFITNSWKKIGIYPVVFRVGWREEVSDIQIKIDQIIKLAEDFSKEGKVSIIGTSAGGSLAFNTYIERPDLFQKAICICGRLRAGNHKWRSLEKKSAVSKLFMNSVLLFKNKNRIFPII